MTNIETALTSLFSRALSEVLSGAERVGICTPAEQRDLTLGLYLYNIQPCFDITPQPLIQKGGGFREKPPSFVSLYYLLTAYSKAEGAHKTQEEHKILFAAIETLLNNPVLTEQDLGFRLGTYIDRIHLQMLDLSPEQMLNILGQSSLYKLSVGFRVTPVGISAPVGEAVSQELSSVDIQTVQKKRRS